jgi:hypothetical protein
LPVGSHRLEVTFPLQLALHLPDVALPGELDQHSQTALHHFPLCLGARTAERVFHQLLVDVDGRSHGTPA